MCVVYFIFVLSIKIYNELGQYKIMITVGWHIKLKAVVV